MVNRICVWLRIFQYLYIYIDTYMNAYMYTYIYILYLYIIYIYIYIAHKDSSPQIRSSKDFEGLKPEIGDLRS